MSKNKNFEKLEEFVCDEDKIVTVPWLSATLAITAKEAKELLNQYITHSRKTQPGSIAILYLLSGLCEKTLTISLAKEDEVDDKKELFSAEPVVEVYSIQKSKDLDFNGVALVDYFNTNNSREAPILGSIISKNCVKRNFKAKKALPPPPAPVVKEKTSFFTKLPPKPTNNNASTNVLSTSKTINGKTVPSPKQQSPFGRYFTNSEQKAVKKEPVTPAAEVVEDDKSTLQKKLSSVIDSDSDSEPVSQRQITTSTRKEKHNKRTAKKRESSAKRRKRIVVEEESDDDIFTNGDDEEDEEETSRKRKNLITDSDEEQPAVKQEPLAPLPKNKKRKLVDLTFKDEEGFTITKKEWVEEDASEDEEVKVAKTEPEPEVKKQVVPANEEKTKQKSPPKLEKIVNGKGGRGKKTRPTNQSTLTSFFKRK